MPIHPNAKQCAYTKVDGNRCGGPCKDDLEFCHHHFGLKDRYARERFTIPALDDQNSVQVAVMEIMNALLCGKISRPDVYALFYGLYIAKSNLKGLTLIPAAPAVGDELYAKAKAEARAELLRHYDDFDENGEPVSLSAILLKELRESAHLPPENAGPEDVRGEVEGNVGRDAGLKEGSTEKIAPTRSATGPIWWSQKKSSS